MRLYQILLNTRSAFRARCSGRGLGSTDSASDQQDLILEQGEELNALKASLS